MTTNHLLSASLFSELFQHNLVSPDGRIIANDRQLRDYSTFLIKQSKDRVSNLYAERKNMVNDVEELLRLDVRTKEEEKLLKKLINELDLKFEEDGLLSMKEPRVPPKRYLGPKEPKKSLFERKIEAELRRVKTLKRDLKTLDDWLEQISYVIRIADEKEHPTDWKEADKRFRQRTTNRMCDMENARMKLIKQYYDDYDKTLKKVLDQKEQKPASEKDQKAPGDVAVKVENDDVVTKPRKGVDEEAATEAQDDNDTVTKPPEKVKDM